MVVALVFANANAWAWYLSHGFRAPFLFKGYTSQKRQSIFGTVLVLIQSVAF
jgi:hypothetical protein